MRTLSILIPARNEEFLGNTIDDILKNKRGDTEIIVGLDGGWPHSGLTQNGDLKVLFFPESIGQRAMTNRLASLSRAKYIMKVDAHCAFDDGFDVKMVNEMQDNWTMVPIMKNLHVFDWVCDGGHRRYQGKSGVCEKCGGETKKDIVWKAKESPQSTSYKVNRDLEFSYYSEYKQKQFGDIVETMSLQGSCFMTTRKKYWELEICDESWGSWGGQGAEVALKTWLSGGRVVVNKKTWYAHLFRTQGGDFGFPYPNPGDKQKKAKDKLREIFLNDKWDKATKPLSWLVKKFDPPEWREENKGIIYYTDNKLNIKLAKRVQRNLESVGLPIVSCSLKPMPHFGENVYIPLERGYLTMFIQILLALKKSTSKYVFFCEHDVMYHKSHFEFVPPRDDVFYYNTNVWLVNDDTGKCVKTDDCKKVSGICVNRVFAIKHYEERLKKIEKHGFSMKMGFEPGTHNRKERVDESKCDSWQSQFPNLDIRHGKNLTKTKWSKQEFRNKKYTRGWREANISDIDGWNNGKQSAGNNQHSKS